ncbi:DUF5134 domain-containing protein [Streptomyces sp. NPDC088747]|uniref:DUF5134 domain-containing protein n=1 Tax=Streptomyces sp. NPDC088747 TaxID=3365886 RepID=UPI00380EBEE4
MDTAVLVPRCLLTLLFTVVAVHGLWHGPRPADSGWRGRGDRLLHAAMAVAMAVMPWGWGRRLPVAAMTVFFVAAALWFPLVAIGRSGVRVTAIVGRSPHAVGMAAMVWMLHAPHAATGRVHENPAGASPPTAGHFAASGHMTGSAVTGQAVTASLTAFLLGCALWSLTRSMPPLRLSPLRPVVGGAGAAAEPYRQVREGAMALGTAVMLVMPH